MEVRLSIEPYMTIMLGSDRSRGYCLEMICADFLAGVNVENGSAEALLFSIQRLFNLLPHQQQQQFIAQLRFDDSSVQSTVTAA